MKYILATVLMVPSIAMAKEFTFTYSYYGGVLKYKTDAKDWSEAFARGSHFCFDFYYTKSKKTLSEAQGLDIIDVCANPR